jgi:poly(A) polymerase
MTRVRMNELRYPKDMVKDTSQLVFLHMRPHTYKMGWTDAAVRRYVRDAGPLLKDLNELVRCDVTTRNERRARTISKRIDDLEERIDDLATREALDSLRPPIDGNDVMQYLGLKPSRQVGEIMNLLLEHRIEEGPYTDEEAYAILDDWAASR